MTNLDVLKPMNRGIELWCNVRVLLAVIFLVASVIPLVGQEPPVRRLPVRPHQVRPGAVPPNPDAPPTITAAPVPDVESSRPEQAVRVPNIVGFELKRGFMVLRQAHLVGRIAGRTRSDEIARQDPPAGALVKRGSTVMVWVSRPPPPPPPPRLILAIILGALAATIATKLLWPKPKIDIVPRKDDGKQSVTPSPLVVPPFELRLVVDQGDQELDKVGPLVEQRGGQWTSDM